MPAATRPLVLLHGYSDNGAAFAAWQRALQQAGWAPTQLIPVSYESLTNEVSIRDLAEGFDMLLQQHAALADGAPFDVMVHSTGMLVLRAWLSRPGTTAARRARLKHLIALAPATFGSPLAHKGRSFLGALVKGRKTPGPDFLEAGDQILDALELGGRFAWQLAECDLFGAQPFYDRTRATPWVFVFCGTRGFRGLSAIANEPGTDGTVRWAGCALDSRKLVLDLSRDCAAANRVRLAAWTHDDVPVIPVDGVDHGTILSNPPADLIAQVCAALRVTSRTGYAAWQRDSAPSAQALRETLTPWQQFFVRAVDERGDGIADWNLQLAWADGNVLRPFTQDVHVYAGDPSYRCFHVNLAKLGEGATTNAPPQRLSAEIFASTGTARVHYRGALTREASREASLEEREGSWSGTLDLSTVLPDPTLRFFYPFTTTFVELRLDREPRVGPGMVIRFGTT